MGSNTREENCTSVEYTHFLDVFCVIFHVSLIKVKVKVKVKVKLSLCLTKHHDMKAYWGSGGIAPHLLDLGTRWR
jgi:hypothetical protein